MQLSGSRVAIVRGVCWDEHDDVVLCGVPLRSAGERHIYHAHN